MTKAAVSTSFHAEAVPMSGGGAGEKSEDPETQSKFLETGIRNDSFSPF